MKVLVLGDTAGAESLVPAIASGGSHKVVAAGALDQEIAVRLTDYFTRARVDAVIDATHSFEASISHQAAKAYRTLGLKHLLMAHPPW
jgi:precorrin-6x reductase